MKLAFTQNDLLRFLYKETSGSETLAISEALDEDWELRELYTELYNSYKQLPKVTFTPSESCLGKVLKYSQKISLEPYL